MIKSKTLKEKLVFQKLFNLFVEDCDIRTLSLGKLFNTSIYNFQYKHTKNSYYSCYNVDVPQKQNKI